MARASTVRKLSRDVDAIRIRVEDQTGTTLHTVHGKVREYRRLLGEIDEELWALFGF